MARITVIGNGQPTTLNPADITRKYFAANEATEAEVREALAEAGYTEERVEMALQVYALRNSAKVAWATAGQAVGLGSPTKPKSGAAGARSLYNAAIGKAGSPGREATAHAPAVARAATKQQQGAKRAQEAAKAS